MDVSLGLKTIANNCFNVTESETVRTASYGGPALGIDFGLQPVVSPEIGGPSGMGG